MSPRRTLARAAALGAIALAGCASPRPAARTPVAWQDWGPAAFARAKAENRILLVDVVAEWCHWCHVMDRTTYADADVVAEIDANFLPVRVDSDARPDVAERYRDFGWPATALLTPDARPVLELRGYQEPAEFAELLRSTAADFRAGRPIERRVPEGRPRANADLATLRDLVEAQLDGTYDHEEHGWGRQKYPLAAPVEHGLLAAWLRGDDERRRRSLDTLAGELKLVDPVWGGMYQYSTHGDWDHPHFEKIAPVQAAALSSFAQAYAATRERRWLDGARTIQRYVRDFLTSPEGGFYASQDADVGAHEEGAEWIDGNDYFHLDDAARRARGVPRTDTNVYADRNGLLVQALSEFAAAARDRDALTAARKAANRIVKTHAAPLGGFTHGAAADAGATPVLHLPDQVAMGRAFLALAEATGEAGWIQRADALAQTLRDRFEDKAAGGFYAHTLDRAAVGVFAERQKPFDENARAARFLIRLHHVTSEELWRESAERALRFFGDAESIAGEGRAVGDYLIALEELANPPLQFHVVGRAGTKETNALHAAALACYAAHRVVKLTAPGDEYPDIGRSAVYVCSDRACSSPVTDPAKLADEARATMAVGR